VQTFRWSLLRLFEIAFILVSVPKFPPQSPPQAPVKIGMMATAPRKEVLEVTFDHFSIGPLNSPPQED
jgi:regulation of enolase protein 1 (concanavalin A-like superfamily)